MCVRLFFLTFRFHWLFCCWWWWWWCCWFASIYYYYLDQLYFGDANIVITFDSCSFFLSPCSTFSVLWLTLVSMSHLFIYLCINYFSASIWIHGASVFCPNEMPFRFFLYRIDSTLSLNGCVCVCVPRQPHAPRLFFHINLLFLSIYLTCYSNVSRKCVSDLGWWCSTRARWCERDEKGKPERLRDRKKSKNHKKRLSIRLIKSCRSEV